MIKEDISAYEEFYSHQILIFIDNPELLENHLASQMAHLDSLEKQYFLYEKYLAETIYENLSDEAKEVYDKIKVTLSDAMKGFYALKNKIFSVVGEQHLEEIRKKIAIGTLLPLKPLNPQVFIQKLHKMLNAFHHDLLKKATKIELAYLDEITMNKKLEVDLFYSQNREFLLTDQEKEYSSTLRALMN